MEIDVLCLAVLLQTAIWPVNRWAMHNKARMESTGIVISLTSTFLASALALATGQSLFHPVASLLGCIMGFAYAIGFCIIIFYCLKIGPSGPTVMINNLGMLWPTLISMFFFSKGKTPSITSILGVVITVAALVLISLNKAEERDDAIVSAKWIKWILVGWIFSGVSLSSQFLAGYYEPKQSYSFAISVFGFSSIILLTIASIKGYGFPYKEEIVAGISTGIVNVIMTPIIFYLISSMPAYIVYPVTMVSPMVFMLFIGRYYYKEKIGLYGWIASAIGVLGIILLNLKV